jgi:hypothetical protein
VAESSRNPKTVAGWRFVVSVNLPIIFAGLGSRELMKALLPYLGLWTVPVSFLIVCVAGGLMGAGLVLLLGRRRPTDAEPVAAADGGAGFVSGTSSPPVPRRC